MRATDKTRQETILPVDSTPPPSHRPPTLDVVQDHPATWDWRLILGFTLTGIAALYFLG